MEYVALSSTCEVKLSKKVNQHLEEGWKLYGGMGVARHMNPIFVQAMTKHKTDQKLDLMTEDFNGDLHVKPV